MWSNLCFREKLQIGYLLENSGLCICLVILLRFDIYSILKIQIPSPSKKKKSKKRKDGGGVGKKEEGEKMKILNISESMLCMASVTHSWKLILHSINQPST